MFSATYCRRRVYEQSATSNPCLRVLKLRFVHKPYACNRLRKTIICGPPHPARLKKPLKHGVFGRRYPRFTEISQLQNAPAKGHSNAHKSPTVPQAHSPTNPDDHLVFPEHKPDAPAKVFPVRPQILKGAPSQGLTIFAETECHIRFLSGRTPDAEYLQLKTFGSPSRPLPRVATYGRPIRGFGPCFKPRMGRHVVATGGA